MGQKINKKEYLKQKEREINVITRKTCILWQKEKCSPEIAYLVVGRLLEALEEQYSKIKENMRLINIRREK